jgi:squalene cyclase
VWYTYWWKGYGYSTYITLKTLSLARILTDKILMKAVDFLISQQIQDGGWNDNDNKISEVFATAFNVLSLLLYPNKRTLPVIKSAIGWLLDYQNADGSWPTVPIMRIPPPMMKDPSEVESWFINQEGTGVIIADQERIFTSAAALWALTVYQQIFY